MDRRVERADRSRSLAFYTCPSVAYAYDMCSLTSSTDRHGAHTIGCLSLTGNSIDRSSGLDRPRSVSVTRGGWIL
jgi:hypothetical protein